MGWNGQSNSTQIGHHFLIDRLGWILKEENVEITTMEMRKILNVSNHHRTFQKIGSRTCFRKKDIVTGSIASLYLFTISFF
jgi:hypothetical protein